MSCALRHTTLLLALLIAATLCGPGCASTSATDRAHALVGRHLDEEAVALLQRRLRAFPDDRAARRFLIALLGLTGDLAAARAEATELARRSAPDDPAAALDLGHALELAHRYDDALEAYDDAARLAPASAAGPREGGMRSAHWGEAELARPRLEEAVRRGARDGETWHALGLVRLHLGDLDGAETAYRAGAAASGPPDDAAATGVPDAAATAAENWLGLATVGVVRGDSAGALAALAAYDRVLALRPRFASAELGRAWALAKLGRPQEAARALDHAAELGAPAGHVAKQREALRAAPSR